MGFFNKNGEVKSDIEVKLNEDGNLENVEFNEEDVVLEGEDMGLKEPLETFEREVGEILNPIPVHSRPEDDTLDYMLTLSEEQKLKLNELIQCNDYAAVGRLLSEHKRILSTPKELFHVILDFSESEIIPLKSAMVLAMDEFDAFNTLSRKYPILKELDKKKILITKLNRVQQSQVLLIDGIWE